MSHPLLEGLDGLKGAALRQRLIDARAAALAGAAGDESHPIAALVRTVEDQVVQAMRAGVIALVDGMQPSAAEEPVPPPAPIPAPRPPMVRVPPPGPVPAPRPPAPLKLAGLKRPAPADDGPPELPEPQPVYRHPPIRPPLPPVRPLPGYRPPLPPPPLDPNDDAIPW